MSGRPERLLADDAHDPKSWIVTSPNRILLHKAEKIVFDEAAVRMAVRLSNGKPIDIARMIDVALPPSKITWIEVPAEAMLDERAKQAKLRGDRFDYEPREPNDRCGWLIITHEQWYDTICIEHAYRTRKIFEWPLTYSIARNRDVVVNRELIAASEKRTEFEKGRGSVNDQACQLWGYSGKVPGIDNLHHKAMMNIPAHMMHLRDNPAMVNHVAKELSGMPRMIVALLALLQTSTISDEPVRPRGRFLSGGKSHPYAERRVASLHVPHRIKDQYKYVTRQIREEGDRIRKRLHKVKAHFRHSRYLPLNGEGWTPCYCPGREAGRWYHKRIDEHMRGDESLGVIAREFTMVTGE